MGNLWRNSIHLLLELNILYFFILLLYLDSGNLPSFAGILLPYGFAIAIFGFLNNKLPSSYVAIMLVAPILALFAYLSSYSIGLSLIIGSIISFRAFMYFVEERFISTFALLIMSFIWMPFVYGAGTLVDFPHGLTLMILFGAQLALVILLYSGNAVFQLNGNSYMQKKVVSATAAVFISIVAVSAVFATIGKYLITAGLSVFGLGVSFIFDILARPVFAMLGMLDWTPKSSGPQDEGGIDMGEEEEAETAELLPPSESLFDNPVVVAVAVILFLSILYLLLNKKKVNNQKREIQSEQQFTSTMTKKSGGGFFAGRRKQKPPEDEVRKLMFDLEQLAIKKNRGRLPNETLEEWLKRETTIKESFMELYAKVRYGEMKLSPSEIETCRTMAEEIRKVMKQWKKAS